MNFPLFLISFAIYNMIVFLTPGVSWSDPIYTVPLYSGASWPITFGDALIGLSLVFLLAGIAGAARGSSRGFFNHFLTFVVVAGATAEFVLLPEAATPVFATVLAIAFVDLVGGWVASTAMASRRYAIERVDNPPVEPGYRPPAERPAQAAAEPARES